MSARYDNYTQMDDRPEMDGDAVFRGVDERIDPANLAPGFVSRAKNVRFREGVIKPRGGSVIMPWGTGDGTTAFSNVRGMGKFSDPSGQEWMIIAAGSAIYRTRPNNVAQTIPMNGNTLSGAVTFEQCFSVLICWRGDDEAPLVMTTFSDGWRSVSNIATTNNGMTTLGTKDIPNSDHAEYFQSRLLVPFKYHPDGKKDLVAVGDIGDYTRYKYPQNAFRINEGSFDEIIRIAKFGRQAIVIYKSFSIVYVDGLVPDSNGDYSQAYLDEATDRHGLLARDSVAQWGEDQFYLSTDRTFTSLRLTIENKVRPGLEPLSAAMDYTFRSRVNWAYASNAKAVAWNDYIYLALPIDDANVVGDNIVPGAATYTTGGVPYTLSVTAGQRYKYSGPSTEFGAYLDNGGEIIRGESEFVAAGTTVDLYAYDEAIGQTISVAETVKPVEHVGVNNGIAVYDTVTKAWAGLDEAEGVIMVRDWVKITYQGQQRLFYITDDGFIRLYEEGYYDEVQSAITPYVDVLMYGNPGHGDTIQVNSGDIVTADNTTPFNGATTWGVNYLGIFYMPFSATTLWGQGSYGYDPDLANTWSAPNTTPSRIDHGVRFTATNGSLPTVSLSGDFAYLDEHDTPQIVVQDIPTSVTTRGYLCDEPGRKRYDVAMVELQTWDPTYTLETISEGVAETATVISGRTRSNTAYETEDATAWAAANANDDHETAHRQDYSVTPADTGTSFGDNGIAVDLHQEFTERKRITARGRAVQLRISNTTGRCIIKQAGVQARAAERAMNDRT